MATFLTFKTKRTLRTCLTHRDNCLFHPIFLYLKFTTAIKEIAASFDFAQDKSAIRRPPRNEGSGVDITPLLN
jgi:hypothetical protein